MPMDKVSSGCPRSLQCGQQFAQLPERPALGLEVGDRRRNAHQSAQLQSWQHGHRRGQRRRLGRRDAALAGFIGEAHLQQHLQRRQVRGTLCAQARCDAVAIDRMHPVEVFGDLARLVPLQLADEMPDEAGHVGQGCDLVASFLNVVFTEIDLAGGRGIPDHRDRLQLAHRHQPHRIGRAPGRGGGLDDPATHGLQCCG